MKIFRHGLIAASLMAVALVSPVSAQGLFPGFPDATEITGAECIPADTRLGQGLNPATECISPEQLANAAGGGSVLGRYSNVSIPAVALTSIGTDTTPVAGTIYKSSLQLPVAFTATGMACLNGTAAATDLLVYGLYDDTGALIANTSLSGVVAAGTNAFQQIAFTTPEVLAMGSYYVVYQTNGTTTRIRTVPLSTVIAADSDTGSFGTLPDFAAFATFTTNVGPICYVY